MNIVAAEDDTMSPMSPIVSVQGDGANQLSQPAELTGCVIRQGRGPMPMGKWPPSRGSREPLRTNYPAHPSLSKAEGGRPAKPGGAWQSAKPPGGI